ncbi:hypothetical protein LV84_03429 [Algoriphagus ratkowskyi]|uniref:Uncharacterized protein n=1 Tax=Algoriphagus ratkowskyi TaxID=57028 RepID=A0A2W7QV68_9BACT|nr:hypothetical protein [Algoriphagus ratkowskyi]PZX52423.1 hypothetical protein LV84_03429 [Algoriphagus ratkowskyi]TXD76229.1 hypothetical protein ESW18_17520 [Algoriphagus ratkowskyi]
MEKDPIQSLLTEFFSQFLTGGSNEEKAIAEGIPLLTKALGHQTIDEFGGGFLNIKTEGNAGSKGMLRPDQSKIKVIEEAVIKNQENVAGKVEPPSKVFVRNVAVKTTQVKNSVPSWAAGAKVETTIGPLEKLDGSQVYLDVYQTQKLLSVYQQGNSAPVMLFKTKASQLLSQSGNQVNVGGKTYSMVAGSSVWIKASMFAADAPTNRYIGLIVKSGKIEFGVAPQLTEDKLTLLGTSSAQISLSLAQSQVLPDFDSKHGIDAFKAEVQTPKQVDFTFKNGSKIELAGCGAMEWTVYGRKSSFEFVPQKAIIYNTDISKIMIPYTCSARIFVPEQVESPMISLSASANIVSSWWAISAAELDISTPLAAAGCGGITQICDSGLKIMWKGLLEKKFSLKSPIIYVEASRLYIRDTKAHGLGAFQEVQHWKDKLNPSGTSISLSYLKDDNFLYFSSADDPSEILVTKANADIRVDRPIQVNGEPIRVRSKESVVIWSGSDEVSKVQLSDVNLIFDSRKADEKGNEFKPIAIALENALFTVSPANVAVINGDLTEDWIRITKSETIFSFGLIKYLPTLPDPYLANSKLLDRLMNTLGSKIDEIKTWLFCMISQDPKEKDSDEVRVDFSIGTPPTQTKNIKDTNLISKEMEKSPIVEVGVTQANLFNISLFASDEKISANLGNVSTKKIPADGSTVFRAKTNKKEPLPPYEEWLRPFTQPIESDYFSLIDVSSNANQLGISVGNSLVTGKARERGENESHIEQIGYQTLLIEGMEVFVPGSMARLFTMPQVAWEPVKNETPPAVQTPGDPPKGYNYYPNDGGPTRILNQHSGKVALAPKPLVDYTIHNYKNNKTPVIAAFTLSFGLKAFARLANNDSTESIKSKLENIRPKFPKQLQGGIHIRAIAGNHGKKGPKPDSRMFAGFTVQLNNILGENGNETGASTLAQSPTEIFNNEFFAKEANPNLLMTRGVPVKKIDFTGYGASVFSNWVSPSANFANTSQAKFDILLGRTAHEVVQVKSYIYPWAIRVVRTITLFRNSSGFVYREDSGWQPESDGTFDFTYEEEDGTIITPYNAIHPGTLRGLYNISNIREDGTIADYKSQLLDCKCVAVWFDADVAIENLIQGQIDGRTPAKKILGYVQIAPEGKPLPATNFKELLDLQGGSIGGEIDCVMNVNASGQLMRISRFEFSWGVKPSNNEPAFVGVVRGSVVLPNDGSWSMVKHEVGTGEVTPLPQHLPIPLIRIGTWVPGIVVTPQDIKHNLLRIANPSEILRDPNANTINYGYLQTTSTQKALFLTPSYLNTKSQLFSRTPPLFADAYRLMTGSGIFPNIGDGYVGFGKAVPLVEGVNKAGGVITAFATENTLDAGRNVFKLLEITKDLNKPSEALDRGFQLLAQKVEDGLPLAFNVPSLEEPIYLVNMKALKIYIEYKAKDSNSNSGPKLSKLNFNLNSFIEKSWESTVNNVSMVVDLDPYPRLMTIKGNFSAKKGKESGYSGGVDIPTALDGIPVPEIEFSDALKPVIELLQLLASLSTGGYKEMMKKGLEIAMSNSGEVWEYKFEATKEIPLIRFPPGVAYDSPQCPLRLEAGLSLGVYFNAALKVTTDLDQLLPTAGAFVQFKGGLEVMCMTVGGATIYAIGAVEVKIACDTKIGPSLMMKFGFGASLSVGLPVIGSVSVTFMVGCEMFLSDSIVEITAFMLFKGHASLAGGFVSITIYIEARGSVKRIDGPNPVSGQPDKGETLCKASMTFGLDICIAWVIDVSFEETWEETRQIA